MAENNEIEKISAYCQRICPKFHLIYNRWIKVFQPRFDTIEINRRWKQLSKRNSSNGVADVKDYNQIVENIMLLTGSHKTNLPEQTQIAHRFYPPQKETIDKDDGRFSWIYT